MIISSDSDGESGLRLLLLLLARAAADGPLPTGSEMANEFTEEQKQKVLGYLRRFEQAFLADPVHGFNNPFRRAGVPAKEIAWECGFLKEGTTSSGRQRVDTAAARRLLKLLVAEGVVEPTGAQRTRSAGSSTVDCFALAGFAERLAQTQAAWLQKAK